MKILFWNVDTQKDFMNKGGALYIEGAENIKENLKKITDYAQENNIKVVSTKDYHTKYSKEISDIPDFNTTFPAHCMVGTEGEEFIEETAPQLRDKSYYIVNYMQEDIEAQFYRTRNIIIYKDAFDVFEGNKLTEEILEQLAPDLIVVYGVATNICVNFAVEGLSHHLQYVIVATDAIKELPNSDVEMIFKKWEAIGVILMSTESIFNLMEALRMLKKEEPNED